MVAPGADRLKFKSGGKRLQGPEPQSDRRSSFHVYPTPNFASCVAKPMGSSHKLQPGGNPIFILDRARNPL